MEELPFRPVRPATLRSREYQVRQFASALVLRGRDPSTLTSLGDLVGIDAFKEGLRFLLERHGNKPSSMIADLAATMKAIARHHVRVDKSHLAQMTAVIRRIDTRRRGLTEKNRARLRAFDDLDNLLALVRLPGTLVNIAERHPHPYQAAVLVQMAVAIEILLMTGLRINNLANLDIERHLVRPSRRKPDLHIVIAGEEVKNREPLDYPLPAESVALIERYLEEFRPRLARDGSTALFPGRGRAPKALNALRQQIIGVVFQYTGLRVNPHLFRHIGAKSFLDAHPGQHEVTRRVLAHRSIETTTAFYTGCETAAAVRHYDETILKLRHTGRRSMTRTLHRDPNRRCLPIAEWPAADRTSWLAALAPGDLLDEGGGRARYAAASNRKTEKGYGRWLAWLHVSRSPRARDGARRAHHAGAGLRLCRRSAASSTRAAPFCRGCRNCTTRQSRSTAAGIGTGYARSRSACARNTGRRARSASAWFMRATCCDSARH